MVKFWGHSCELGDDPALWAWFESILARISADPEAQCANVVELFEESVTPSGMPSIHLDESVMVDKKNAEVMKKENVNSFERK